jgi:hypothetical protein
LTSWRSIPWRPRRTSRPSYLATSRSPGGTTYLFGQKCWFYIFNAVHGCRFLMLLMIPIFYGVHDDDDDVERYI